MDPRTLFQSIASSKLCSVLQKTSSGRAGGQRRTDTFVDSDTGAALELEVDCWGGGCPAPVAPALLGIAAGMLPVQVCKMPRGDDDVEDDDEAQDEVPDELSKRRMVTTADTRLGSGALNGNSTDGTLHQPQRRPLPYRIGGSGREERSKRMSVHALGSIRVRAWRAICHAMPCHAVDTSPEC